MGPFKRHAEYLKLRRSLAEGRVFDLPPQTAKRYAREQNSSPYAVWRFSHKSRAVWAGKVLRLEILAPAVVHWSCDNWESVHEVETHDTGIRLHIADLSTDDVAMGAWIRFTFYWPQANRWEGQDFAVQVVPPPA